MCFYCIVWHRTNDPLFHSESGVFVSTHKNATDRIEKIIQSNFPEHDILIGNVHAKDEEQAHKLVNDGAWNPDQIQG